MFDFKLFVLPIKAMTKAKPDEREMQKRFLQLQLLKQYASAMIEEKGNLENKISEIAVTMHAVERMGDAKNGQEMMASLGSDAYINSNISDADMVIIGVGSGIYLKKKLKEAGEVLGKRRVEFEKAHQKIVEEVTELVQQIEILEKQVQE